MSPIEEIRSAVEKLRALAAAATPGPWMMTHPLPAPSTSIASTGGHLVVACCVGRERWPSRPDARYIVAMGPLAGLALADWLDAVHTQVEQRSAATLDMGVDQAVADAVVEMAVPHALTLARLILAGGS